MTNPDNIHGVLIYPHAHWSHLHPHNGRRGASSPAIAGTGLAPAPVQMEMPKGFVGSLHYSGNQFPDPMSFHKAATKLYTPEHTAFTSLADHAAKHYLNIDQNQGQYEHLHGIGTWMDTAEPSIATVFKQPINPEVLARIGAHVGREARQQGVLAFSANPGGKDRLLHMRLQTHRPNMDVDSGQLGDISTHIGNELARHSHQTDDGLTPYLPAVTVLPDHTGHTDVLTWVNGNENDVNTKMNVFRRVADHLRARKVQFYPGTGILMGMPDHNVPDDSDMPDESTDEGKRLAAIRRYRKIIGQHLNLLPRPTPTAPMEMMMRRALKMAQPPHAAGTGTIVRGINYPAGQFVPPVVTSGPDNPLQPPPQMNGSSGPGPGDLGNTVSAPPAVPAEYQNSLSPPPPKAALPSGPTLRIPSQQFSPPPGTSLRKWLAGRRRR